MDVSVGEWIGGEVRDARRARRMSQARLAAKVGVVRETIYRLEKGRMATPDVLGRVCDVLDLDRDMFKLDIPETDLFGSHPELTLLRERRRSLRLTLAECAAAAGVSPATLSRFERGGERSRAIAKFNIRGEPIGLINEPLATLLGFRDLAQMDLYWRTGRLAPRARDVPVP